MSEKEGYTHKFVSSDDLLGSDPDANDLISSLPRPADARLMGGIDAKPGEQLRLSLGTFTTDNPPKGFSVELTPDPDPADSVVTQMVSLGTDKEYELVLQVANYGNNVVKIEVWSL